VYTVLQQRDVEIDQQAQRLLRQTQVREQLFVVDGMKFFHGFQLDDDGTIGSAARGLDALRLKLPG
jgi:hypothetical protein